MNDINYDAEADGYIWTNISKGTKEEKKSLADRIYAKAEELSKSDDFPHICLQDSEVKDDEIELKVSLYPDESEDEETYTDGAYFSRSFGNYLPNEKVCRVIEWDFDSAKNELKKLTDLLEKEFPADDTSLIEDCFDCDTDSFPEPAQPDAEYDPPEYPEYLYED